MEVLGYSCRINGKGPSCSITSLEGCEGSVSLKLPDAEGDHHDIDAIRLIDLDQLRSLKFTAWALREHKVEEDYFPFEVIYCEGVTVSVCNLMGKDVPRALQAYKSNCDDSEDYQEDDDPHRCYDLLLREAKSSLRPGYRSTLFRSTLSHESIEGD